MSKFQPLSVYQQPLVDGYQLLPFRFTSLNDDEYVLTNQAGEFIVLERPALEALVRHQLPATNRVYDDLKSKHFIIDRRLISGDWTCCRSKSEQNYGGSPTSLGCIYL